LEVFEKMTVAFLDLVLFPTYFLLLFFSIFWLFVLFSTDEEKEKKELKEHNFSAIVPAYNEERSIEGTLQSLVDLDYPANLVKIVVVNDGSTDKTKEIVEGFIRINFDREIVLINQENQGKGVAMNRGLEEVDSEFFACLDADSFVGADALKVMLPLFGDRVAAVCPLLKVKRPKSVLEKIQWGEYIINMFYRSLNAKLDCVHVTPGPFSVYKTEIVKEIGGFDEQTITEDLEIAIRLQKYHYKIVQTFDTVVETMAPHTWRGLFRQRVRWYKGGVDNTIKYKKLLFNRGYGDFGMLRMPTIVASGVIVLILTGALLHSLGGKLWRMFFSLKEINFDIITLIRGFTFDFNFLSLPFFKIAIAGTLFVLSFIIMIYSFKLIKERVTRYGKTWVSLFTYLFIYSLFLTTVWIYIAYMFVRRKGNFWS
jgi:cellulose synthase/poly-beta-1,6-N-acetylglucosamine synthase-like glycosyltransferase